MASITSTSANETLVGSASNDTFLYALGSGNDTISDTGGADTLMLSDPNSLYSGLDVYRSGTSLVFDFLSLGKITIAGQFASSLTATTLPASRIETMTSDDGWGPFSIQNGLSGTTGNDLIVGTSAAETISGGTGDDLIWGGAGNDSINAGSGSNEAHGGAGNDTLFGGVNDDGLYGGLGSDSLNGGTGYDIAYYDDLNAGVFVNLSGQTQAYGNRLIASGKVFETLGNTTDTLSSIEEVHCTNYADYVALGRADSSTEIYLGKGNDTVDGGLSGNTSYWTSVGYWDDPHGIIVNLGRSALTATLEGVSYNVARGTARDGWGGQDTFIVYDENLGVSGSGYADYIRGRDDTDSDSISEWFGGGKGNDTIDGGTGSTDTAGYGVDEDNAIYGAIVNLSSSLITVSGISVAAGTASDNWRNIDTLKNIENVNGSYLADYIVGSATNNGYLSGEDGNDTINGGGGTDWLDGGNGNDWLIGGLGVDYLTGGTGNDRFDFNGYTELGATSSTNDKINDFVQGQDKVDLSTLDANNNSADGNSVFSFISGFTTTAGQVRYSAGVIYLNTDTDTAAEYQIQLVGNAPATMSASDFVL